MVAELDLLVVGDLNPDLILRGEDVRPRFGQVETIVDSADLVIGGSAAIAAVAACRLGLSVGLCAVVGDDRRGETIRSFVEAEGVNTDAVRSDARMPTGLTVILAERDDRAILTSLGTIAALTSGDLAALRDAPARHVHIASYYLMSDAYRSGLAQHLSRFRNAGSTVSLDTNWDPSELWDLADVLAEVDVFLPNEAELRAITRKEMIEEALSSMGAQVPTVAVKLGVRGGAVISNGSVSSVAADRSGYVIDTVGAGDSFDAGFITGVLSGRSAPDSLRLAVAVGTLSTRGSGGTASQPSLDEAAGLAFTT
ncbi:MAG: hypothetical protein BMS9Abin12_0939 [Acidimicrobiia bacterium]|nr:MAG: hypothetical protein BMS9Abin12_0939 [Acidimicrobiia bacterium]